jgi:hypothetical protein
MFKYYSHNILKIGLLITATQFLMASGCNKDSSKPCALVTPYSFNVTSEFSPQKEVYNIGDTIYLNSTFPKTLTNLISNQQVDYSNSIGIGGTIAFTYLDTLNKKFIESFSKFEIIPLKGTYSQTTNVSETGINNKYYEDINYEFKIAVKTRQKGIFWINYTDLISKGLVGKNCTNAGFSMTVKNTNKNFNLFQYAMGYTPDALLQKSIYCFRVQ